MMHFKLFAVLLVVLPTIVPRTRHFEGTGFYRRWQISIERLSLVASANEIYNLKDSGKTIVEDNRDQFSESAKHLEVERRSASMTTNDAPRISERLVVPAMKTTSTKVKHHSSHGYKRGNVKRYRPRRKNSNSTAHRDNSHPMSHGDDSNRTQNSHIPIGSPYVRKPFDVRHRPATSQSLNLIDYHGGPVMWKNIHVYIIYYGHWGKYSRPDVIRNFVKSLSNDDTTVQVGSANSTSNTGIKGRGRKVIQRQTRTVKRWWNIVTAYGQLNPPRHVSSQVLLMGEAYDPFYSYGTYLSQEDIQHVVEEKMRYKWKGVDPNGIYFVLTSPDVYVTGFCEWSCAWHWEFSPYNGVKVPFSWVGNAVAACPTGCIGITHRESPNMVLGMDGIVDSFAHELAEAATDPFPITNPAWFSSYYLQENADICTLNYGEEYVTRDGRLYNLVGLKGMKFRVQSNFDRLSKRCRLQRY